MIKKIKNISKNTINIVLISLLTLLLFTYNFEVAYIVGICFIIIFNIFNIILFSIKKIFNKNTDIFIQAIILAIIISLVEIVLKNSFNQIYIEISSYFPLLIATCLLMKKNTTTYNSKRKAFLQSIYIELSFVGMLIIIAGIREILSTNILTVMKLTSSMTGYEAVYQIFPFNLNIVLFSEPIGAFIIVAIIAAIIQFLRGGINNESN